MSDALVIKALIKLDEVSDDKKPINYKSGVMPNHYIPESGGFAIGKIEFINKNELSSGDEAFAYVYFLIGDAYKDILKEGYEWPIHEGPLRKVGVGKVLEIIEKTPKNLSITSLKELEKQAIIEALERTNGNREKAAKTLGIGERTIYRKIKEYNL